MVVIKVGVLIAVLRIKSGPPSKSPKYPNTGYVGFLYDKELCF